MESRSVNLVAVSPGTRLVLADGSVVEVLENPGDGTWVFCRPVAGPDGAPATAEGEQPVFAPDVIGLAEG